MLRKISLLRVGLEALQLSPHAAAGETDALLLRAEPRAALYRTREHSDRATPNHRWRRFLTEFAR